MRRLLRIVFNALTVLSLVLAVLVAGLWVRSYWRKDWVRFGGGHYILAATRGEVWLNVTDRPGGTDGYETRMQPKVPEQRVEVAFWPGIERRGTLTAYTAFGLVYMPWVPGDGTSPQSFRVPIWYLVGLSSILPAKRLAGLIRSRLRPAGLCASCGYDLRATPDRCPECGTASGLPVS